MLGASGGGPHALACAHRFGHRMLGCSLAAGVGALQAQLQGATLTEYADGGHFAMVDQPEVLAAAATSGS